MNLSGRFMNKIYYLSSCSTCKRILETLDTTGIALIDIKKDHIGAKDLDYAASRLGGYENMFNKRAVKYRSQGLNQKVLTEADFRALILEEYTYLKRPLFLLDQGVYIGNAKHTLSQLQAVIPV